jgi:archaellum component FlaC
MGWGEDAAGGLRGGSRQVRVAAAAEAADDLAKVSRAQSVEGHKGRDSGRLFREDGIIIGNIQSRLGTLDGDVKGVTAQVCLVRESVGKLQGSVETIAADVTRVGNDLKSVKEELKNEANANKEELKKEISGVRNDLKSVK